MSSFKNISVDRISENKRTIEVKGYLQDVVTSLTPEYKRMDVAFEIEGDEVSMVTYPGLIGQIVTNLIMNALRHGFHGRRQGKIRMEIMDEGEQLRIRFHDDGRGIPPEHRERIFDPFFTTKLGSGGSGLGLSIVYNAVVQKLKGWIRLVQADVGTTFDIMIPKGDTSDA
jgi:signal transduction histidine kinase